MMEPSCLEAEAMTESSRLTRFSAFPGAAATGLSLVDFDHQEHEQKGGGEDEDEDPQHHDGDCDLSERFAPQQEEICVMGAAATKTPRKGSKNLVAPSLLNRRATSSGAKKSSSSFAQKTDRRRTNCGNNNDEDATIKRQWESEMERLREDAARWKRELKHVREEKSEIEKAFLRLNRENVSGYNLAERTEKEVKIAELVTKNQRIAQLLEKELNVQAELRASNAQLISHNQSQREQLELLNSVFPSLEVKHAALNEAHATLKASFDAAQVTIEKLQGNLNEMQARLIDSGTQQQRFREYEHKIQVWERKYLEMERRFSDRDQRVVVLTQEVESLLENRANLEKEIGDSHDQVICMNAMMKTMEAKIEASLQSEQARSNVEKLHERIRLLESELLQKNRAFDDLSQSFDEFLNGAAGRKPASRALSGRNSSSSSFSTQSGSSRLKAMISRVAALTEKLQLAEELRERKARNLDVLMQAFPYLLQQLDALHDKFMAATEANEILKSALEQMQQQPSVESGGFSGDHARDYSNSPTDRRHSTLSPEVYLRLARENYLLSAPYQVDLLTGYTGAPAFTDFPTSTNASQQKAKRFPPFRVVKVKGFENQEDEDSSEHNKEDAVVLAIVADTNDVNGASYLNRSKINAFLQFIQGKAAKKKFKEIIFTKVAELVTKLRELKIQFAAETTAQRATIQMLQREVDELKHKLQSSVPSASDMDTVGSKSNAVVSLSRRKLLVKLIDLYADKQQQHRQSTFLTQTAPSDVLISNALTFEPCERETLDISDCSLDDDEISEVLVKILVSGVQFHELRLDSNALSDTGAQYLANFLEKCPRGIKVVSVDGNSAITYHGMETLKRGLLRNATVHRIEVDPSGQVIDALAAQDEYELHGQPTVVLRLFLPKTTSQTRYQTAAHRASEEHVKSMMDCMHQMGFTDLFAKKAMPSTAAFSIYSAAAGDIRRKKHAAAFSNGTRTASLASTAASSAATRRQAVRRQQEQKFRHLEAAIKRATTNSSSSSSATQLLQSRARSTTTSRSRSMTTGSRPSNGVSISLAQSFTGALPRRSTSTFASSSSSTIYGNAHLATVRRLKR